MIPFPFLEQEGLLKVSYNAPKHAGRFTHILLHVMFFKLSISSKYCNTFQCLIKMKHNEHKKLPPTPSPSSSPRINGAENRHTMKIKPDVKAVIRKQISSSWKIETSKNEKEITKKDL